MEGGGEVWWDKVCAETGQSIPCMIRSPHTQPHTPTHSRAKSSLSVSTPSMSNSTARTSGAADDAGGRGAAARGGDDRDPATATVRGERGGEDGDGRMIFLVRRSAKRGAFLWVIRPPQRSTCCLPASPLCSSPFSPRHGERRVPSSCLTSMPFTTKPDRQLTSHSPHPNSSPRSARARCAPSGPPAPPPSSRAPRTTTS